MKYVVQYSAGMRGTDYVEVTEDVYNSEQEVYVEYESAAWEHFWQYNDESDFEDMEPELDMWIEEFDPSNIEHTELLG